MCGIRVIQAVALCAAAKCTVQIHMFAMLSNPNACSFFFLSALHLNIKDYVRVALTDSTRPAWAIKVAGKGECGRVLQRLESQKACVLELDAFFPMAVPTLYLAWGGSAAGPAGSAACAYLYFALLQSHWNRKGSTKRPASR